MPAWLNNEVEHADDEAASMTWRADFMRTFLERDIPQLGITVPAETLRRFWTMVAHYHGQVWNAAQFARLLGASETTARRYLDILAGAYVVRILPPWFANIGKRQVKAPKIYIRDSGLLHALLPLTGSQMHHELRAQHKRIADGAAAGRGISNAMWLGKEMISLSPAG